MEINDKYYLFITEFDVINDEQFLALTNYGVTFFDVTMIYDGKKFETVNEIVDFITLVFSV